MDLRFPLACFGFSMALLAIGGCSPDDKHQQASLEERKIDFRLVEDKTDTGVPPPPPRGSRPRSHGPLRPLASSGAPGPRLSRQPSLRTAPRWTGPHGREAPGVGSSAARP